MALLVPLGEQLWPLVTPGAALLAPLSDVMATWPGGLNLLVAALVNGVVLGAAAAALSYLLHRVRGSRSGPV